MINYWFGPYSANDLTIEFDLKSAEEFLSKLKRLENTSESETIYALKINRSKYVSAHINLSLTSSDDESLTSGANFVNLVFADDAIEYAEFKINEYIKTGCFSPAEFLNFRQEKTGKSVRVYFVSRLERHITTK